MANHTQQTEVKSQAKRILVVEDEFVTAMALKADLIKLGYEVSAVVDTGEEAVRKAAELRPDLILMDIVLLGQMSGIEAATAIKQALDIPIVYLTAHSDTKTIAKAKLSEPYGYLPKPCDTTAIMSTIEMALYKSEIDAARKQAEEALRKSELWLHSIFHALDEAVLVATPDRRLVKVNRATELMFGYCAEELSSQTTEMLHVDQQHYLEFGQRIQEAFADNRVASFEFELQRKNGEIFPTEHAVSLLKDNNGEILGIVSVVRDITERKKAESIRQEAHEKLLTVLNQLDAIVYVADMETHELLFVNNYVQENFGDITGKVCWQTLQKDQAGPCDFCTNRYLLDSSGKPSDIYIWEFQNTVTGQWLHMRDRAIEWVDGRIVRLEIATDISEQKRLEAELKNALEGLEERVKERTLELQTTHEQLLHSEKLSAIGSLSASIAHEINNPLAGITNVIQGLKRRATYDEEDGTLIDMAIRECGRIRDLIRSLQDFNRPSSGRSVPMNIHATIDSLLLLSKKEFHTKKITVETHYAAEMPMIKAVADQIKQVLLNLLKNACDACEGGGTIGISTEVAQDNIVLTIEDNGGGIKPEHIMLIFNPFFTTKPDVKGTGLGLSISYGIIKKHGGRIEVKSEPENGTVFTITLPIAGAIDAV